MSKAKYFNHSMIRTLTAVFGKMFSKLYIAKFNADATQIDKLKLVPIRYLPMDADHMPDQEMTDQTKKFYDFYPRMTYEFTGLNYSSDRQMQLPMIYQNENNISQSGYTPAPYDLTFDLHVVSREQLSALQIIEQIMPYFRPQLTVSIDHPAFDLTELDVTMVLNSIDFEDNFTEASSSEAKRIVHYTLSFTIRTEFWPFVQGADIELAKFYDTNCSDNVIETIDGLIPVDDTDEDDEDVTVTNTDTTGVILKIVIDQHDYNLLSTDDLFWPVQERTTVEFEPDTAASTDDIESYTETTTFPTDEATERIPES